MFILQHLLEVSIIVTILVVSRKFEGYLLCLFEENNCSPALIKVPNYSTGLAAVIFVCSHLIHGHCTRRKFSIKDFSNKSDQTY